MNEKPIPSDAVIEAAAQALFHEEDPPGRARDWDYAPLFIVNRHHHQARLLFIAVMPQLSADVLRHVASELQAAQSAEWTARDVVGWLRHQAEAVLT